jgi:2-C-methyl-D-erythritol 4-phosphate cytidylyltransferase
MLSRHRALAIIGSCHAPLDWRKTKTRHRPQQTEVNKTPKYFALIPAAGGGTRFGGAIPKQYQLLGARTMLEHAVEAMLGDQRIERVLIVVAPNDGRWARIGFDRRVAVATVGGESRAESVRNGLKALQGAGENDWVLVHDAARPCLTRHDLVRLLDRVGNDPVGGLLALQVADTVKRGVDFRVEQTLRRDETWLAMTPQMFRIGALKRALDTHAKTHEVTDESAAMERMGLKPLLIAASPTNIKVTTRGDFTIAEAILRSQGRVK